MDEYTPEQARKIEDEQELTPEREEYTPVRDAQTQELSMFMLQPDDIIEFIENELRGWDYDYKTGSWKIPDNVFPVLSEEGIRHLMRTIRFYVNKVAFLSNYDEQHIYDEIYALSNNLTQFLFNNGERFGIQWEMAQQSLLIDSICDFIFKSLRKAYMDKERTFFGSHTKILHRIDDSPYQKDRKRAGLF